MNEELRIIIQAETAAAQRNIGAVREELEDIRGAGGESGKSVDAAMATMAKGAAIAAAAIAALTAAMFSLGKAAQEVEKGFAKLNTTFLNAGTTTEQAGKTYKELFSFLGEHDKAIETAQSLALITSNEQELAEWTNILQGAFAEMGEKLPTEGLAEAVNETIKVGQVTGVLADALNWAGVSEDGFNAALAQTTSTAEREALVRNTLNGLYSNSAKIYDATNQATKRYNESQADLNIALSQAAAYTTPFLGSVNELGTSLLTVLAPALGTVANYLTGFIELLAEAIQWIGNFFGMFSGGAEKATADTAGYKAAMKKYLEDLRGSFGGSESSIDGVTNKLKELKKQTMGFDELNVVSDPSTSTASSNSDANSKIKIPEAPNPEDYGIGSDSFEDMRKNIDEAKENIKSILPLIAAGAAAWAGWNLAKFIKETGAGSAAVKGLKKAAEDLGFKWKGFDKQLSKTTWKEGLKTLADKVGPIMLMVAGIASLTTGIMSLVNSGYSLEAVILVVVGVLLILAGVIWALVAANVALSAAFWWITAIVAAIALLVGAFVILWNECEGFRNFWINLWEIIKKAFNAFVESMKPAIDAIVNAFKQAWELIKVIWNDYLVPMFKAAWEAIKVVWNLVEPYFKNIWNGIKAIFSVVGTVLVAHFKIAWEGIKAVWSVVVSYFKMIWDNIALIFSSVRKVLSGDFKGAWEDIKKIFSNVGTFFKGVFDTVVGVFKNVGSIIGGAVSKAFSTAINFVLESAINIINGFIRAINLAISILNAIPGVSISTLSELDVPKLARGGITTGPTAAIIGEAGKEAVLPLENNTGWMNELADKIAQRQNTPSRIVLMIDGKELGWASINNINDITRQTGELPLVLV